MIRKRLAAEQVIHKLCEKEVEQAKFRGNFSLHFRSILHYKGLSTDLSLNEKPRF